ncbi:Patched domain-containing protein 3, partial [Durusdinium trenchii]
GDELKVLRTLEAEAEAKLKTCGCLMQSLQKAAEALNGCGNTLQREVLQSSRPLAKSFAEEGGEEEMHPSEEYSSCIFRACESLGAALLTLAAALTGDLLTPLNELRRHMTHERKELQEELERLQQREMLCCEAMAESVARKEKVSSELQERLQQSQEKGREKRLVRWILKKTSKARASVPPLRLADLPAAEEVSLSLNTASCTSGSSGEILNCEERHCSLSGKLDKGDPLRCAAAAGAERAVPRAAREVSLDGSECMAEDT